MNRVNRTQIGRGTDFKQDIVDYIGINCYFPTIGNFFEKCINHIAGKDFTEEFLTFIQVEQRRSIVMITTRIQQFCKKHNKNICRYDGLKL